MKVFGILESELSTIALCNTLSTACFSLSAGSAFCAIGIWAEAVFAEKLTPAGDLLATVGFWGLLILAMVFAGIAMWAHNRKGSTWETIWREPVSSIQSRLD